MERPAVLDRHPLLTNLVAVGAGLAVLNRVLAGERQPLSGENVFELMQGLDKQISAINPDIQYIVMGGVASSALTHEGTEIDFENSTVTPPKDIFKDRIRKNGTVADCDLFFPYASEEEIATVRNALLPDKKILLTGTPEEKAIEQSKLGTKMTLSCFGVKNDQEYNGDKSPLKRVTDTLKRDFVSDRTRDEEGNIFWNIGGIKVELPASSFDTWGLVLPNGESIPMLHPVAQILCYAGRVPEGIRVRDVVKIIQIQQRILLELAKDSNNTKLQNELRDFEPWTKFIVSKDSMSDLEQLTERKGKILGKFALAKTKVSWVVNGSEFFVKFSQGGIVLDKFLSKIMTGEIK